MKLSALGTDNETIIPLHPEMGEVGVTFVVCSPFSREHNASTSRLAPELLSGDGDKTRNWEIFQAESVMVGWTGLEDEDDKPLEFSKEECSKLFRDERYHWMVSQVLEHIAKKKGYLQTISNRFAHLSK